MAFNFLRSTIEKPTMRPTNKPTDMPSKKPTPVPPTKKPSAKPVSLHRNSCLTFHVIFACSSNFVFVVFNYKDSTANEPANGPANGSTIEESHFVTPNNKFPQPFTVRQISS